MGRGLSDQDVARGRDSDPFLEETCANIQIRFNVNPELGERARIFVPVPVRQSLARLSQLDAKMGNFAE
jgi:hypothetical protein